MTSKKIILIVVGVAVVLGLIVLIFVGGILGSIFYGISNSEAAEVSREFLRNNAQLKEDIGEVKEFGKLVTGNINLNSGDGTAELSLKVVGERKTVTASLELIYRKGKPWRVVSASYKNDDGQTIDLLNPYEVRNLGSGTGFPACPSPYGRSPRVSKGSISSLALPNGRASVWGQTRMSVLLAA